MKKILRCYLNLKTVSIVTYARASQAFNYRTMDVGRQRSQLRMFVYLIVHVESKEGVIMFSGKVQKWNKYTIKQERSLVITNLNIYNFKRKKLRRTVSIGNLAGLTKLLKSDSQEFVIHVKQDYDYRLESPQ